jgi:hypothetical protein
MDHTGFLKNRMQKLFETKRSEQVETESRL